MDPKDKLRLHKAFKQIQDDLRVSVIMPYLLQSGILTDIDFDNIRNKQSEREKVETLLQILPKRGPKAYKVFRGALQENYEWLATTLDNVNVNNEDAQKYTEADKYQVVTKEMIDLLRNNVQLVRKWHALAHQLGMTSQRIQIQVQANLYMWDLEQCILNLLEQWRALNGKKATLCALLDALRKEQFNDIADELEDKFL